MTGLEELKRQANRVNAVIVCPSCPFEEDFDRFLDRDDRVSEDTETVHFGCPRCGSDTVDLGKRRGGAAKIVVNGIEELEQLAGG